MEGKQSKLSKLLFFCAEQGKQVSILHSVFFWMSWLLFQSLNVEGWRFCPESLQEFFKCLLIGCHGFWKYWSNITCSHYLLFRMILVWLNLTFNCTKVIFIAYKSLKTEWYTLGAKLWMKEISVMHILWEMSRRCNSSVRGWLGP